jgi:TPR repeat protein
MRPRVHRSAKPLLTVLTCLALAGCGGLREEATALGLARPAPPPAETPLAPDAALAAARAAEARGDYETAEKQYIAAAGQGSVPARLALGALYLSGTGVQQNYAEALHWLEPAARAGNAEAQLRVGLIYEFGGSGVTGDAGAALDWYQRAAAQGLAQAQYRAGKVQLQGVGGRDNPAAALALFRAAAAQNLAQAQTALGQMYLQGRGVRQDAGQALLWLKRGAEGEDPDAMVELGRLYWEGNLVGRNVPEGTRWLQRAAALGSEAARHELALPPRQ